MSYEKWQRVLFKEAFDVNPKEILSKDAIAKKVSMDKIFPYTRSIQTYEIENYKGGSKFRNGDTLLSRITPCLENGKTAQVNFLDENEVAFGSTEFIVLRGITNLSDNDFAYYYSITPKFRERAIKSMVGTSGRQRVQINEIESLMIDLPPLEEQKGIAAILSSIDNNIEINNKILRVLEEMGQAIFKNWFIDFEPFTDRGFIESEMGAIPAGWRVGTLQDIVEFKNGYSFKNSNYDNNGKFRIVTIKNVNDGELDNRKFERYSEIPHDLADHQIIQDQDILMTLTGNVGRVCLAYGENLLLNQRVAKLFCKVPKSWVYFYFRNPQVKETLINIARGSAQANLSIGDMYSVSCIIPDKLVLEQFNLVTEPIINLIVAKFKLIQAFEEIRDSLLPKLMSGDIRVPIKEI